MDLFITHAAGGPHLQCDLVGPGDPRRGKEVHFVECMHHGYQAEWVVLEWAGPEGDYTCVNALTGFPHFEDACVEFVKLVGVRRAGPQRLAAGLAWLAKEVRDLAQAFRLLRDMAAVVRNSEYAEAHSRLLLAAERLLAGRPRAGGEGGGT